MFRFGFAGRTEEPLHNLYESASGIAIRQPSKKIGQVLKQSNYLKIARISVWRVQGHSYAQ